MRDHLLPLVLQRSFGVAGLTSASACEVAIAVAATVRP
jgi:hypothetical protein